MKESIHLRALGRENPLDEYHRVAVEAFGVLSDRAIERAVATFETAEITPTGIDLDEAGLRRPLSTWTYVVHDNPWTGSAANSAGLGPIFGG